MSNILTSTFRHTLRGRPKGWRQFKKKKKKKRNKIKSFFRNRIRYMKYKKTHYLYIFSFALAFISMLIKTKGIQDFILSIAITTIILTVLLDAFYIMKKLAGTTIGKVLYSILAIISFSFSLSEAKKTIYFHTGASPDSFDSTINLLTGIYSIFTWIGLLNIIILAYIVIFTIILILSPLVGIILQAVFNIFSTITFQLFDKLISSFFNYIAIKINKKIKIHRYIGHSFLILFAGFIFIPIMNISSNQIYKNIKESYYTKRLLIQLSYYKHNGSSCKEVAYKNQYIKLLEDNKVSVVRIVNNKYVIDTPTDCK